MKITLIINSNYQKQKNKNLKFLILFLMIKIRPIQEKIQENLQEMKITRIYIKITTE